MRLRGTKLPKNALEGQCGTLPTIFQNLSALTYGCGRPCNPVGKHCFHSHLAWGSGFESLPYCLPAMRSAAVLLTPLCPHFPICAMGRIMPPSS